MRENIHEVRIYKLIQSVLFCLIGTGRYYLMLAFLLALREATKNVLQFGHFFSRQKLVGYIPNSFLRFRHCKFDRSYNFYSVKAKARY